MPKQYVRALTSNGHHLLYEGSVYEIVSPLSHFDKRNQLVVLINAAGWQFRVYNYRVTPCDTPDWAKPKLTPTPNPDPILRAADALDEAYQVYPPREDVTMSRATLGRLSRELRESVLPPIVKPAIGTICRIVDAEGARHMYSTGDIVRVEADYRECRDQVWVRRSSTASYPNGLRQNVTVNQLEVLFHPNGDVAVR
jgi:hypothetical protein